MAREAAAQKATGGSKQTAAQSGTDGSSGQTAAQSETDGGSGQTDRKTGRFWTSGQMGSRCFCIRTVTPTSADALAGGGEPEMGSPELGRDALQWDSGGELLEGSNKPTDNWKGVYPHGRHRKES